MELTQTVAQQFFSYDPDEGVLRWRVSRRAQSQAGDIAGSMSNGARQVEFFGRAYLAHRIIWLYMTGSWPKQMIDHINGVRDDNRWCNLRDVSRTVNENNRREPGAHNSSGFLGVTKHRNRWRAQIKANGRNNVLGVFDTPEEAHEAYVQAKRRLHEGCTI